MSTETCKLCHKDCTPWVHINGHICQDCYANSEWISIEHSKIPEIYNKPVLVTDGHVIDIASLRFIDGHLRAWDKNKLKNGVTHWMPLPSPPEVINET